MSGNRSDHEEKKRDQHIKTGGCVWQAAEAGSDAQVAVGGITASGEPSAAKCTTPKITKIAGYRNNRGNGRQARHPQMTGKQEHMQKSGEKLTKEKEKEQGAVSGHG